MGQQCTYPSLARASKEIDLQVDDIERKIAKSEDIIRYFCEKAPNDPVAKQRALQAMKRKKMLEAQRQDLIGAQFNVDNLTDQQEQAKFTLRAVEAMKAGHMNLKKDQSKIDIRQVEEMLDQAEDMADDMRAISESLARGSDQASLESELMAMQSQYAPQVVPDRIATGGHAMVHEYEAAAAGRHSSRQQQQRQSHRSHGREAELPPPPPPPPPARAGKASPMEDRKADLWAASALSAAMAPYGHLNAPFPRQAVAA